MIITCTTVPNIVQGAKYYKDFVRFGKIKNTKSLNFRKLTSDQLEDVHEWIRFGDDLNESIKFAINNLRGWRNVDIDAIFECGISVFNAKHGVPIFDNIDQVQSSVVRLNEPMYEVVGDVLSSFGQDAEPLIANITEINELTFDRRGMEQYIVGQLSDHYEYVDGEYDPTCADRIFPFWNSELNCNSYRYKGYTFTKPKSSDWIY
jgi:hypothetical protein